MAQKNFKIRGTFVSRCLLVLLLLLMWNEVEGKCKYKPCESEIHTMCKYPEKLDKSKPKCGGKAKAGLTSAFRKAILDKHNALRQLVAQGKAPKQPSAANMMKLRWNHEAEEIAQRFVNSCPPGVEHDHCRDLYDGTSVGQNSASGAFSVKKPNRTKAVEGGVQMWYDEIKDFDPAALNDFSSVPNFEKVGHYTQLVWAESDRLGCGYLEYEPDENFQYYLMNCNYAIAGNMGGAKIYEKGKPCSKCPKGAHCSKRFPGLCTTEKNEHDDVKKKDKKKGKSGGSWVRGQWVLVGMLGICSIV